MTISARTPLWVAAPVLLAARIDDFFARWRKVLKTFDAEDIHDLRVSSRRLREGCALFAPLYTNSLSPIARRVRKVTRLMGALRNTDEALLFFRRVAATLSGPCGELLGEFIGRQEALREDERHRLAEGLLALDAFETHAAFVRGARSPAVFLRPGLAVDPFTPLGSFAAEALDERLAGLLSLVSAARDEGAVAAQHALRIAVKHYRYRMEILSFLMADGAGGIIRTLKAYQESLGTMHDLDVFADMVRHEGLSPECGCVILNAIAERRRMSFVRFAELLGEYPFELIGEQMRRTL